MEMNMMNVHDFECHHLLSFTRYAIRIEHMPKKIISDSEPFTSKCGNLEVKHKKRQRKIGCNTPKK